MTTLTELFENSQRLAITAAEEAERFGHPEIDVEHVFLALLVSETDAGRLLRGTGIGLAGARAAVQAEHGARLAALGIRGVPTHIRPIPADGPRDVSWNERALELFSEGGGDGSGLALLRSLVTDPGGFCAAVVARLGADPEAIVSTCEERRPADSAPRSDRRETSYDVFVPAALEDVWALLDDPARLPGWELAVEVTDRVEHRRLEWRTNRPGRRRAEPRLLRATLTPQPGGTRVRLSLRPGARTGGRRLRAFLDGVELSHLGAGLSRACRR